MDSLQSICNNNLRSFLGVLVAVLLLTHTYYSVAGKKNDRSKNTKHTIFRGHIMKIIIRVFQIPLIWL